MKFMANLWGKLQGKKFYCVGALMGIKAYFVYQTNDDKVMFLNGLIEAAAIIAGRSTLDKVLSKKDK